MTSTFLSGASLGDRIYRVVTTAFALTIPLLLVLLSYEVLVAAWPALRAFGVGFLTSSRWDAVEGVFGVAPAIYGTVVASTIAVVLAAPFAVGVAIFCSEIAPGWLRQPIGLLLDLLAAIPSVIYGLWGLFVLVPFVREQLVPFLTDRLALGDTMLFRGPSYGPSMLAAGLLLAIMILPFIASVMREVLLAVPRAQREAALALGATRWEVIRVAVLPYARSGIIGGIILGLGRALGETMAVTMVIGSRHEISASLLAPGYTLASLIANEFAEATGDLHLSALMAAGAVLLFVTIVVNALARWLVWRMRRLEDA